jgi:hypothetical protein
MVDIIEIENLSNIFPSKSLQQINPKSSASAATPWEYPVYRNRTDREALAPAELPIDRTLDNHRSLRWS